MKPKFNYKMLILARESRCLTQSELAEHTGIPQSSISKIEHGALNIDTEHLKAICSTLKYPKEFFYQEVNPFPPNLHYRKRTAIPIKILSQAEAIMNIYRANVQSLLLSVDLDHRNIPSIDGDKIGDPVQVARYLRQYWQVPKGAIDNVTKLLESKGIVIVQCDLFTEKIVGRSMTTEKGNYIIFLNKNLSGDRHRFTLAHELAHIIMHLNAIPTEDRDFEEEANIFADEFLMPQNEIQPQLSGKLTIQKLADLKRYWKVSMAAILVWAERLNTISQNQAKYLWAQFSAMGMRKREPIDIGIETPVLLYGIIKAHTEQLEYSIDDLSKLLCLSKEEFEERYIPSQRPMLRVAI